MTRSPPTPLRASQAVLAEWQASVVAAQRHLAGSPKVLVGSWVVVAIDQELQILRSQIEALRQLREEKT